MSYQNEDWLIRESHRFPLLTAAQEIQLARQVQAWLAIRDKPQLTKRERAIERKGRRAYEQFFLANIRLVASAAGRCVRISGSLTFEDLMQEGLIGLERAIVKFDHTRGYKFSTYAFNWIRQSINRAISRHSRLIRLPDNCTIYIKEAKEFSATYELEHGRKPTLEQMAAHCKLKPHTLKAYMVHALEVISLDQRLKHSGGNHEDLSTFLELIPAPEADESLQVELDMLRDEIDQALGQLTHKQYQVIQRRYGMDDPVSYANIAAELSTPEHKLTRQAIQQHHDMAVRKLRMRLAHVRPHGTQAQQCAA